MDGKIVAGNPNQDMGEGYDQANRINTYGQDFKDQYYDSTEHDKVSEKYKISEETKNLSDEERSAILTEKKNKILAAREQKKLDLEKAKATAQAMIEARKNSPVNNNSPLHQEQEVDPRTGQPKKGYEYIQSDPIIGETIEEIIYNEDGSIKGTNRTTPTTINFDGTQVVENVEETPGSTTNPTPPAWSDCYKNGVFQTGAIVGEGANRIICEQKPPSNDVITTPPEVIEEAETLTDQYSTTTNNTVFTPVVPEPIPESASDLFNLGSGKIKKGGMKIDWDLRLPQFGPEFTEWVKNLTKAGKKCGNCDYLNR